MTFPGFRTGARAATLPAAFFTEVLPEIEDPDEVRVTAYALYAIARPGKSLMAMRASELAAEEPLARWFAHRGGSEAVRRALDAAVARGVLLSLRLEDGDALYFVHHDAGRRLRDRLASGAVALPGAPRFVAVELAAAPSRPAAVYEQEIGTITPAVTSWLAEAEAQYPETWVVDALYLAVRHNARSWRYAEAILRRWEAEGRDDEVTTGDPGREPANPYDALVRRTFED
jgi:DnaD/phage-associated family protein